MDNSKIDRSRDKIAGMRLQNTRLFFKYKYLCLDSTKNRNKFLPAVELPAFSELRYVLELQKVRVYQMLVSLVNYFCLGCVFFKQEIVLFCSNNLWYFGSIIETRSNSNQYFSLLGVLNLPQDGVNWVDFAVLKTLVSMWR